MTQEALKIALEASNGLKDVLKQVNELVAENKALKEALAQPPRPMQECPNDEDCKGACFQCEYFNAETGTLEYPPREHLAQRTWAGLTEERIREIWLKGKDHGDDWQDVLALARSFEAKLRELNT